MTSAQLRERLAAMARWGEFEILDLGDTQWHIQWDLPLGTKFRVIVAFDGCEKIPGTTESRPGHGRGESFAPQAYLYGGEVVAVEHIDGGRANQVQRSEHGDFYEAALEFLRIEAQKQMIQEMEDEE